LRKTGEDGSVLARIGGSLMEGILKGTFEPLETALAGKEGGSDDENNF